MCNDIDECNQDPLICGSNAQCSNTAGNYSCSCKTGFTPNTGATWIYNQTLCNDIDECNKDPTICGSNAQCTNIIGNYSCSCDTGFTPNTGATWIHHQTLCQDIDECNQYPLICGSNAQCSNTAGNYSCSCKTGFTPNTGATWIYNQTLCNDIDECNKDPTICGSNAQCTNIIGNYSCSCDTGFTPNTGATWIHHQTLCQDIDECAPNPIICGPNTICSNTVGHYICTCKTGFIPSPGATWIPNKTQCEDLMKQMANASCPQASSQLCFLSSFTDQLKNGSEIPVEMVASVLGTIVSSDSTWTNQNDKQKSEAAQMILTSAVSLVSAMIKPTANVTSKKVKSEKLEIDLMVVGSNTSLNAIPKLEAQGNSMEVDLQGVAKENNKSYAAAVFISYNGMSSLLSASFFVSEHIPEINSEVISATLPEMQLSNLSEPVNFTLKHSKPGSEGNMTCVYWKTEPIKTWSPEGCEEIQTNETHTVCSCTHLSTFALIMEIEKPQHHDDDMLELINLIAVPINLFFLSCAIITFTCCQSIQNANNTIHLHLSICLFLAHLLFLTGTSQTKVPVLCAVIAGLLHYLFLASFAWMCLEGVQLYLQVRNLRHVRRSSKQTLRTGYLLLAGYGTPLLIVAVSAALFSDGYMNNEICWLSFEKEFRWSFLGPVALILAVNMILFGAIIWTLQATLSQLNAEVSSLKESSLLTFKALVQFWILGCSWFLGFFPQVEICRLLFIVLNSQQGTMIFIVYCLLNREVRKEYKKWFCCQQKTSTTSAMSSRGRETSVTTLSR
ncbi:adhesion G protein-coupled receptor E1-like [Acipenser oxyrinchus oxyrinchus]|uniref:Adhesion G protein-coupled receptor E1-like n=1 Tax=Acipenser oxyrinchus oxyrinchus TaxID=40147 RepID=A0AAD8CQM7_ACIOX|nr:adhesion G protein-coupled receptor E1-like [Acipenser oxyrinchus oxyrinchus]